MKYFKINIILFLLFSTTISLQANELVDKVKATLRSTFSQDAGIKYIKLEIPSKLKSKVELESGQKFLEKKLHVFNVEQNDSLIGLGVVDNVMGKHNAITFLVILDKNYTILKSQVLVYRESHGGAVQNENWLAQFQGKDANSSFGSNEIDGIAGATISVNSMTHGIKKLAILFKELNYFE